MIETGGGSYTYNNMAYSGIQLKVRDLGTASSSFEYSYDPALQNQDFSYAYFPKSFGRKKDGSLGAPNSYLTCPYCIYHAATTTKVYEQGTYKFTFSGTTTTSDKFGFMFYGNVAHYTKNGVVVYTSTLTDPFTNYSEEDYMILVHGIAGNLGLGGHVIWNNKVVGETKPFSWEKLFEKQFKLSLTEASPAKVGTTAVGTLLTGSTSDGFPTWDPSQGNWFKSISSRANWTTGFSLGPSPTVTASFTGSGDGGIFTFKWNTNFTEVATNDMMHGWVFDDYTPTAATNYNQMDPAYLIYPGKPYHIYYQGAQKSGYGSLMGESNVFATGSRFVCILTGSDWGGVDYASETGNSTYFFWRLEGVDGGIHSPDMFSNDWIPYAHYKSLFPGSSAEAAFAFSAGGNSVQTFTSFKYGGDIHA
jgi:hypothetical protein